MTVHAQSRARSDGGSDCYAPADPSLTNPALVGEVSTEEVGRRVRQARLAAGLTQEQVADGGTISVFYLSRIEAGHRRPGAKVLGRLAEKLGVSAADLIVVVPSDQLLKLQLAIDHAELALTGGDAEGALAQAIEAEATAVRLEVDDLQLRASYIQGLAQETRGNMNLAMMKLEEINRANPEGSLAVSVGIALSRCHRETGAYAQAIEAGEAVLTRLAGSGRRDNPDLIRLSVTVAMAYAAQGDITHAARIAQRAIADAERISSPEALAAAYWNSSIFEQQRGCVSQAIEMASKALTLLENAESNRNVARLRSDLARLHLDADQPDIEFARGLLDAAAREMEWTSASPFDIGDNLMLRARAMALTGDFESALELLERFPAEVAEQAPALEAEHLVLRGSIMAALGDWDSAKRFYEATTTQLERADDGHTNSVVWFELGHGYRDLGEFDRSAMAFERAAFVRGSARPRLPVRPDAVSP
jgi:tetratricopeptide (TPR) repeat protein